MEITMSDVNLVIQTQRLGDIVMSFPLCSWLHQKNGKQVWLIGEEKFYKDLFRLSPENLAYITLNELEFLSEHTYSVNINLSHNPKTYSLAAKLQAKEFYGNMELGGIQKIHGLWQLYRASLTNNNHYNAFHWADLNALDCIDLKIMGGHTWKSHEHRANGKIGIFIGASELSKRPDANFWAELGLSLAQKGYEPIFLGGPSQEEQETCKLAANLASMPMAHLAGRFSLFEFTTFLQTLDLFITPDTGPMHLASINGIKTFNLSMGNVNPYETGPYPPNHYVLRSSISCSACWQCNQKSQLCKKHFVPARIANLIHCLLQNKSLPTLPNLILYKTARTIEGLYELEIIKGEQKYINAQTDFWRYFFADYFFQQKNNKIFAEKRLKNKENLFELLPKLRPFFKNWQHKFLKDLLIVIKKNAVLAEDNWLKYPPLMRPLTNFSQLFLENESYAKSSHGQIFQLLEFFQEHIKE